MWLLDTNILSEMVRSRPDPQVRSHLAAAKVKDCYSSVICRYELHYGAMLREDGRSFWIRLQKEILSLATWLPVSAPIADTAAQIAADLSKKGIMLDTHDLLIAATALENDLILITRNTRHFNRVPSLKIENWFSTKAGL